MGAPLQTTNGTIKSTKMAADEAAADAAAEAAPEEVADGVLPEAPGADAVDASTFCCTSRLKIGAQHLLFWQPARPCLCAQTSWTRRAARRRR